MAYNEEKITKVKHLKELAQRIKEGFASRESVAGLAERLEEAGAGKNLPMYQTPTFTQYRTAIIPPAGGSGPVTGETVGSLLGEDRLAGLTASGTDETGKSLYDFIINGVKTGSYTRDTVLCDILDDVNGNEAAGVRVSYSERDNSFTFTARKIGAGVEICFDSGLAGALFDAAEAIDGSGIRFTDSYGVDWMNDGESMEFTFGVPGIKTKFGITNETTLQEVVNNLNDSLMGGSYSFACNRYTGQIEAKDKTSGAPARLSITDPFGDNVVFNETQAPTSPYTYGRDAVYTAIKVNGELQAVANREVNITVPTRVSALANDSKFQTDADVAAAVAAADHLKRRKVASRDDIDPAAPGAEQIIWMVPKTGGKDGDKYDEYMVLDGVVEAVGNWEVDLSGYQTAEEGKGLSSNDFTDELKAKLEAVPELAADAEVTGMLDEVFG